MQLSKVCIPPANGNARWSVACRKELCTFLFWRGVFIPDTRALRQNTLRQAQGILACLEYISPRRARFQEALRGLIHTLLSCIFLGCFSLTALADCSRIISLAPSITEIIYELKLDSQLIAVSRFDQYPPQVASKTRIGGFFDPNYELMVSLQPTVVFGLKEHRDVTVKLEQLDLLAILVEHRNLEGIDRSIRWIADICGVSERAAPLISKMHQESETITGLLRSAPERRVMLIVGEPNTAGRGYFLSGNDGYFSELFRRTRAKNVHSGKTLRFPSISREGIATLNPDIIIHLVQPDSPVISAEEVKSAWRDYPQLNAVRTGRIHRVTSRVLLIPGPRYPAAQRELAELVHPEFFVERPA